jgi:DNA replication protein DnaC
MKPQTNDEPVQLSKMIATESGTVKKTCQTHGDYESKNLFASIWSACPRCTSEHADRRRDDETTRANADKLRAWQTRLGSAGIPPRFVDKTLGGYSAKNAGQQRALDFACEYAKLLESTGRTGRSAIFCGKPGTGKTHLAVGIGLHVMRLGQSVLFMTVQRAVRRVKSSWRNDSGESEGDVIKLLVQPDLLILDEIGVQFGTDFEKNLMFDILNERYENKRPTLLLSNLPPSEVKNFLGERVYDRMREDGGKCIPFDWESFRGSSS